MTEKRPQIDCSLSLDLNNKTEVENWFTILDGVMGGRSTGSRFSEDGHMTFKGLINTNGGGFSSLRRSVRPGLLKGAESLNLKLRQDGRAYRISFRTNERYRGRLVSYQLKIPQTPKGVWKDINLPFIDFRTSVFGREVPAAPFDPAQVGEIGLIIADGVDGPFELNIKSIEC